LVGQILLADAALTHVAELDDKFIQWQLVGAEMVGVLWCGGTECTLRRMNHGMSQVLNKFTRYLYYCQATPSLQNIAMHYLPLLQGATRNHIETG
jgi:hypothetical protein